MKNNQDYILERIKSPSKMSVDTSLDAYKKQQLQRVYKYQSMGYSLKESIDIVNGDRSYNKKNKNNRKVIVTIVGICITAVVLLLSYFLYLSPKDIQAIQTENAKKDDNIALSQDEMILFVGSDERPAIDKGSGTSKDVPGVRTDVMALISIPQDGSRAVVTSIPRDLNVNRPKCSKYDYKTKKTSNTDIISPQNNVKINSIYEQGGPQCLVKTIDNITGENITRYAQINFDDFSTIIDSIGGVEITVNNRVEDEILGTIIPHAGVHVLDGEKALDYARARHVIGTPMNDFDRINRQQEVMKEVVNKIQNSLSPSVVSQIITKVLPNMTVDNLGINDALQIMNKASHLHKDNIFMGTIPVLQEENDQGNILYDNDIVKDYFSSITSERPINGQDIDDTRGFYGKTVNSSENTIMLVYEDDTENNKEKLEQFLYQNGFDVESIKKDTISSKTSTIYTNSYNANEAATMMYVLQDADISTEKLNINEYNDNCTVIVIGKEMNIYNIPPADIKVFIPFGTSEIKNVLPVFLN